MNESSSRPSAIELDFSSKLTARYGVICDGCNKEMKGKTSDHAASLSYYEEPTEQNEYGSYKSFHFCGKDCMKSHVGKMK